MSVVSDSSYLSFDSNDLSFLNPPISDNYEPLTDKLQKYPSRKNYQDGTRSLLGSDISLSFTPFPKNVSFINQARASTIAYSENILESIDMPSSTEVVSYHEENVAYELSAFQIGAAATLNEPLPSQIEAVTILNEQLQLESLDCDEKDSELAFLLRNRLQKHKLSTVNNNTFSLPNNLEDKIKVYSQRRFNDDIGRNDNPLVPEQKEYRLHVMAGTIYLYFHFYMGNGKVNLQIVKENLYLFLGVSEREFTKKVGFNLYDFINLDICKSYFETLTGENGELYITISNNNETERLKIAAAAIKLGFNNSKSVNKETSKYLAADKGLKKVVGMKDQASIINTDYNCKDEEFYDYDQIQSKVTANRVQEVEQCNYEDNLFCESNKFNQFLDGNYDQMPGEREIRNTLNKSKLSKKRGQYIYKNSCKSLVLDGFDVVQTTLGKMVMYYIILLGPQYYCSETALFHNVPLYLYHFEENIKLFTGFNFDFEFCQKYFGLNTLKDVFMKYFSKEIKIEWNANNKFLLVICDRRVIQKNFDTAKKKFAELTNVNEFKESSVRQDVEDAKVFATATNWIPYGMTAENLFIKNNYHKE